MTGEELQGILSSVPEQLFSSSLFRQSASPSHSQALGIQCFVAGHWNSVGPHVTEHPLSSLPSPQ